MATKKSGFTAETETGVEEATEAIPEVIQALEKRIEKIEKKENEFTDSQAFVNRGAHPNQIA